jgi:hypothetical protein
MIVNELKTLIKGYDIQIISIKIHQKIIMKMRFIIHN